VSRARSTARLALVLAALVAGGPAAAQTDDASAGDEVEPALADASVPGPEADGPGTRTREVGPGDTLWSIAAAELGDATLWPALYRANRDRIKDPAAIYPGQRLAIPTLDPASAASVRREGEALAAD
jgi:nucleoid-associated protein YgaU